MHRARGTAARVRGARQNFYMLSLLRDPYLDDRILNVY